MGEAIFTRYSKGSSNNGGFSEPYISDGTKAALGLPNTATLDDCLRITALKSNDYGTVQVRLLWPDNTPVITSNIQMTDGTGAKLNYRTDGQGYCVFTTTTGQMTFSDAEFYNSFTYFDLRKPYNLTVDCPMGSVKSVTMQRTKNLKNGGNYEVGLGEISVLHGWTHRNIGFSGFAFSADITIIGASGCSGRGGVTMNRAVYAMPFNNNRNESIYHNFGLNLSTINSSTSNYYKNTYNFSLYYNTNNRVNNARIYLDPGGKGEAGETKHIGVKRLQWAKISTPKYEAEGNHANIYSYSVFHSFANTINNYIINHRIDETNSMIIIPKSQNLNNYRLNFGIETIKIYTNDRNIWSTGPSANVNGTVVNGGRGAQDRAENGNFITYGTPNGSSMLNLYNSNTSMTPKSIIFRVYNSSNGNWYSIGKNVLQTLKLNMQFKDPVSVRHPTIWFNNFQYR